MKRPFKVFVKKFLSLALIIFSTQTYGNIEASFEGKSAKLFLRVANTNESRSQGLMFQESLQKNHGMVFIWPSSKKQCMWMKNTSIPLSVAYLGADGRILEIYDMVPFSEEPVCSSQKARMAVEVNQGWFSRNLIAKGDKINL
ncbi:DUF192 domain-containing protein [Gammaproteobacteria bacterium]|nr:DUF192 domain-containing protein [Gammaproteobacteria bacterium]